MLLKSNSWELKGSLCRRKSKDFQMKVLGLYSGSVNYQYWCPGQAIPRSPTMAYWRFEIKITWEAAGVGLNLWLSSISLNAENKSLCGRCLPCSWGPRDNLIRRVKIQRWKVYINKLSNAFTNSLPKPKPCLDSFLMSINFLSPVKFSQTFCFFVWKV